MVSRRCMVKGRANPLHRKFPQRLRKSRQAAQLTASALSLAAGMGRGSAAQMEAGPGVPLLNTAERLANVLQVSPGWLAYGVDGPWEPASELRCKGLASRLRQLRDEQHLTLAELGRRAGSSANAVRSIERGTLPTLATLEELAEAVGVSPAWLAYGIGSREPVRRGAKRPAPTPARWLPTHHGDAKAPSTSWTA